MKESDSSLVCVFKGQAFEAEVVRARLEDSGIDAMVMNNTMSAIFSTYTAMAGSWCVMVNPQNEEEALELLSNNNKS
ncbi:MAG: DUF2007 domain-containing protein [Bacteroidaceae bacterium]|nr:DUF2007 domain-containing protein [Bacteroidaceae bacterium]